MIAEYFIDTGKIDTYSGIAFGVNRPVKHGSNPIYPSGTNDHTWDHEKNGVSLVHKDGATIKMWNFAYDLSSVDALTYQYSSDGLSWTRPNLGLVSYGGNTNNNICLGDQVIGMIWDETISQYVGCACVWNGNIGVFVVSSADGVSGWTLQNTILVQNNGAAADYTEGNTIVQLSDGKYAAYGIRGHINPGEQRSVHAWTSDTTSLSGAWTYRGNVISYINQDLQRYTMGIHLLPGTDLILASSADYNATTEQLPHTRLYVTRDGVNFTLKDAAWFSIGASGAWDDEVIFYFNGLIEMGDEWWIYYSAAGEVHATFPRDARIGIVKIDKGRIGQVSGTGNLVTTAIITGTDDDLILNVDATGGSLRVELLDESNNVVSGYDQNSFDVISNSASFAVSARWNGQPIPSEMTYKLKFYLTDSALYSYSLTGPDYDLDLQMLTEYDLDLLLMEEPVMMGYSVLDRMRRTRRSI